MTDTDVPRGPASIRLDQKLWDAAAEQQAERAVSDPWYDVLREEIGDLNGKLHPRDAWTIVGLSQDKRTQEHNRRLGSAIRALGFERKKVRFNGKPDWGYVRGDLDPMPQIAVRGGYVSAQ